jgi:hypothetical protein
MRARNDEWADAGGRMEGVGCVHQGDREADADGRDPKRIAEDRRAHDAGDSGEPMMSTIEVSNGTIMSG